MLKRCWKLLKIKHTAYVLLRTRKFEAQDAGAFFRLWTETDKILQCMSADLHQTIEIF